MSLVDKIPHLVSALAFGYGVGMAAPDQTVSGLQGAVVAAARPQPAQLQLPAGYQLVRTYDVPIPLAEGQELVRGAESGRLSELRSHGGGLARGAYTNHRTLSSPPPRYQSRVGEAEIDELELGEREVQALSRLQMPDLAVSMSRETLKYVRFFGKSDKGRGMFEAWLKRSGRYQEMIQHELRGRRLPEDLMWVAMIESGFDATARSHAGATGLWQFMPATGAVYGLQQNKHVDQRRNPRLATQAAAHHLRDLYARFGDWNLALAAYNMGYEQLLDRIDHYGTADFNELVRQGGLPSETSKYVPKIAAAALIANNLERFGFDHVEPQRPIDAAEIPVPPRTPLRTVAKAAGVPTSTIKKLNPDVLTDNVPPGRGDYLVMIPPESVSRAMASLPAMLRLDGVAIIDDAGMNDPLSPMGPTLAPRGLGRDVDEGESLLSLLPKPKKKMRRSLRDPLLDDDDAPVPNSARDPEPEPAPERKRTERETVTYRVAAGDTLIGVARKFAADVEDVASDNDLAPNAKLREGATLKLKVRRDLLGNEPAGRAGVDDAPRTPAKAAPPKGKKQRT